uniref:Anaphase-promoting complex subunit 1 n=1 Tax=Macrostomum lignano TaxID=282301 RepID=A0A1I8HAW9_9PLAT
PMLSSTTKIVIKSLSSFINYSYPICLVKQSLLNLNDSNHFREAEQDLSDMITPQRTESFTPAGRLFAQRMMQPGSSASRPSRQQQQPLLFALRSIHLNDYDNQPLLTRQLQQQAVKQDEQSRITDNWIIRDRDELYWFDCLTVWSRCHEPMQTFTTLSPVLAASFVSFPLYTEPFAAFDLASYTFYGKLQQQTKSGSGNVKVMSGVAMLENDCITFLSETGSEHRTRVPFPCQRMLAHSEGLLLEREIVVSNAATEDPNLPVLFSLSHPLDDVAPVLRLKQSAAPITVASSTAAVTNYFTSSCGKLVYVCQTTGAAFVLQEQQQQHMLSLYRLRYITDAELAAWHRQVRAQYLMMSTLAGTAAAGAAAPPGPVFDTPCVRIPPNQQQQPLSAIPKHLLPDSQRLSLSPGAAAKNIVSASVPALDAVWVPNQRLIVTLEPPFGREFTLCSGPQQICRLALSDFDLPLVTQQQPHQSTPSTYSAAGGSTVPSGNNSMRRRLRDASLNAFNVQLGDCGSVIRRVILPPMSVGQLVSRCLDSLQQLLPKDAYLNLLRRWYTASHSPGSRDGNTISNEWHRFDEVLRESLDLIGTEDATISTSGCQLQQQSATTDDEDLAKRPRQSSGDADWYKLIEQSGGDRFDDLFKLAGVKGHFKGAELGLAIDSSAQ